MSFLSLVEGYFIGSRKDGTNKECFPKNTYESMYKVCCLNFPL